MRSKIALVALSLALVLIASPMHVAAKGPAIGSPVSAVPVTGTFVDALGAGTFSGTLDIERFAARERKLVALGTVSGTLTDAVGGTRAVASQPVTLPVSNIAVTAGGARAQADAPITTQQAEQDCGLLHLEFGGITLDILGLQVALSPIVLDIGLGGILGGLLCGLLGALVGGAPAPAQANMLNTALGLNP